jgi:hypothetical protein
VEGIRDQLFPGAVLARDKHAGVGGGDAAHQVEHLVHSRVRAEHRAERLAAGAPVRCHVWERADVGGDAAVVLDH